MFYGLAYRLVNLDPVLCLLFQLFFLFSINFNECSKWQKWKNGKIENKTKKRLEKRVKIKKPLMSAKLRQRYCPEHG
jgi:hypothetical protein